MESFSHPGVAYTTGCAMSATPWPPAISLVLAGLVFLGVLLSTPPGPVALIDIFRAPVDPRPLAASYAVGAAALLSLIVLLGVAVILTGAERVVRAVQARRTAGQGSTNGRVVHD